MMLTKHFVFVHVPRTGGQFIRKICFEHLTPVDFIPNDLERHSAYDQIMDDYGDLPAFTLVRNPWEWYVSWYHHTTQTHPERRTGAIWESAFDRGRSDFRTTVRRACTGDGFESPHTSELMKALPSDHYTALHTRIAERAGQQPGPEVIRLESVRDDLLSFLRRHDVPHDEQLAAAAAHEPPVGASRHGPYRDYYDEELRELVRERARAIIDTHGYEF